MATWILFDALLVCMLLLIIPIGFWRGGIREAFVGGGILAGSALGNAFSDSWGLVVADVLGVRRPVGQVAIAQLLLWGTVVVLGYGGGAVVRMRGCTLLSRISGAILSLFNGLLLLSASLSLVNRFTTRTGSPSTIREGYVARLLAERTEGILFIVILLVSLGIVAGLIARIASGWSREDDMLDVTPDVARRWPAAPPTPRFGHVERHTADDKFERRPSPVDLRQYLAPEESSPRARFSSAAQPSDRTSTQYADRVTPNLAGLYSHHPREPETSRRDEATPPSDVPADGVRVVEEWLRRAPAPKRSADREGPGGQRPDGPARDRNARP